LFLLDSIGVNLITRLGVLTDGGDPNLDLLLTALAIGVTFGD